MNKETQRKIITILKKAKVNLVEYYKILLSDRKEYRSSAPFHFILSDVLLKNTKHFAIEMFRESAKSTYVLKVFPLYALTYPSIERRYIVLIKQNQTLAESKLKEIIDEYLASPVLSATLVKIHRKSAKIFELTVLGRGRAEIRIRMEAYGKGASVRGLIWGNLRPQVIIGDDLQDLEDSKSETVLEKDWEWFLSDIIFLSKTGRIFLIGNNLGKKCIVERVIDSADELGFDKLKIPAIDDDGNATWPEQFPLDFLEKEKDKFSFLGKLSIWYRERLCLAIAPEDQEFKQEYFKYFNEEDLPESFDIDITVDPAISQKKDACDTAICGVAKHENSPNWYILDVLNGKMTPYDIFNNTLKMVQQFKKDYPFAQIRVWIEGVAYQEALKYIFTEEMLKTNEFFFLDTFVDKTDKLQRIRGLIPLFRVGVIYMRQWMTHLQEELLTFPVGKTIDSIDALSFQVHIKNPTTKAPPKSRESKTPLQQVLEEYDSVQHNPSIEEITFL